MRFARWAGLFVGMALLATASGCSRHDGFGTSFTRPEVLTSSLGCTFHPDEPAARGTETSGDCDFAGAPIRILFFDTADSRRAFADGLRQDEKQHMLTGYQVLLIAGNGTQAERVRKQLGSKTVR